MEKQREESVQRAQDLKKKNQLRAIILPGNGNGDVTGSMWYPWIKKELEKRGLETILVNFPDPLFAREKNWVPFVVDDLGADENTILIGHSSGAVCILRILERVKVKGAVMLAAYDDPMGDELEMASGYFDRPFEWEKMKDNAEWLVQMHCEDDPLVPVGNARKVNEKLRCQFIETETGGHFQDDQLPTLLQTLCDKLQLSLG